MSEGRPVITLHKGLAPDSDFGSAGASSSPEGGTVITPDARLLEPIVEINLYDPEHVVLRVEPFDAEPFELVLEDARWKELSRRRVTLRFNEAALFRQVTS